MNRGYNNNFNVDYACPGFCSKCFIEIAEFRGSREISPGIFRPIIIALKSNFRSQIIYLSDGSQMAISLCQECYNLTSEDLPQIMINEVKGWEREIKDYKLDEKVSSWVNKASKLTIVDAPEMKFSEEVKASLLEESKVKEPKI